ncbi:hypothetical protein L1267_16970 [Pseudoalteromonas sp. OFAV1]|uniref:hypothetical protein n=1 Tax=Pseudoalteromonas sp. OFAV1 TaxID=2908892 RepID=UPI001F3CBE86|nr:hypothetical protein [Pseudoalteromonas sp. OFAV1]MCF2902070.1 hypothetical protein [Pseudoalteromonas sp. OFAV1]
MIPHSNLDSFYQQVVIYNEKKVRLESTKKTLSLYNFIAQLDFLQQTLFLNQKNFLLLGDSSKSEIQNVCVAIFKTLKLGFPPTERNEIDILAIVSKHEKPSEPEFDYANSSLAEIQSEFSYLKSKLYYQLHSDLHGTPHGEYNLPVTDNLISILCEIIILISNICPK